MTREEVKKTIDEHNAYFKDTSHSPFAPESKEYFDRYEEAKKWRYHYELEDARIVWINIKDHKPKNDDFYILIAPTHYKNDATDKREKWKRVGGYAVARQNMVLPSGIAKGTDGYLYKFKYWSRITSVFPLFSFDNGYKDVCEQS